MKKVSKTIKPIVKDNSGESMVEVIVAFTLLTIVLLMFAQGIASATNSESNATKSRKSADNAMIDLQEQLINPPAGQGSPVLNGEIKRHKYEAGEYKYVIYRLD